MVGVGRYLEALMSDPWAMLFLGFALGCMLGGYLLVRQDRLSRSQARDQDDDQEMPELVDDSSEFDLWPWNQAPVVAGESEWVPDPRD